MTNRYPACRPTVIPVKGDVIGIERAPGRTEVLVDEGLTQAAYVLDEGLIDLGAALEFLVCLSLVPGGG